MKTRLAFVRLYAVLLSSALAGAPALAAPQGDLDAAYLDVSSKPNAEIFVDEVDTGKVTPQSKLALKPGHHRVTLVTLDGTRRRTVGVTVEAGQTRKLTVHLAP